MRSLIFTAALIFCSCEYASPVVGVIGHGFGAYQRNELINRAIEISDTTAHNNQMLLGLCNKFEVDTAAPVSTPVEKPEDSESNPLKDYAGLAGLAGLVGLLGKLAKNKQVQEPVEKAAKEKLG